MVGKEICFGEKENPKKTFYHIKDQFFLFYFAFIKKNENKKHLFDNNETFYEQKIAPQIDQFVSF
ncbi:hypothetical protein [Candidatus Phytoplasma melaleucae]|uniref:Uncharacterized protein n=1 Tax=Candidatus Phytoplasma melaleucae TaxID=2982630 RepID=A0ABT9DFA7_9MOLU|nr:hypothetical protein ['Melaleuca sp.' phytoplasma]MDO8168024.1 hypothetical protein ['Melaleuca sp.' phytoplasma]